MASNICIKTSFTKLKIRNFYKKYNTFEISNDCICSLLIITQNNIPKNVLIAVDVIWFSELCTEKVKNYITKKLSLNKSEIVLSASHTHGTPNPEKSILAPPYSANFEKYLYKKIIQTFEKAKIKKNIPVKVEFSRIPENTFSVNRRRKALSFSSGIKYNMQNLPNFKKKIDKNIDLIEFISNAKRKTYAALIKVNCHPVASPYNIKGADYIGYLKKEMFKKTSNIFFLQGFCGDIRPKIIKKNSTLKDIIITTLIGKRFRKQVNKDSELIGKKIYRSIINRNSKRETIIIKKIQKSYNLKYNILLANNEFLNRKLDITIWNWGEIVFLFLNAEVLSGYNIFSYKGKKIICVGYSNGMLGYLPTATDIQQGGYEIDKSRINFNINNRIASNNEELIQIKIQSILNKI
ncbi:hypothetical protein OA100_00800 [Alphaproteobacteria bacterium]|nr:hypothetical protein [Alphaproteobacteria bacterium]